MKDISQNLLSYRSTIQDLLHALNQGIYGAVFVVDDNSVMVGMFTDGDVRRALLKGARLGDRVDRYMNRSFIAGSVQLSRQENIKLLSETIRHLPILDDGRPVDIISWVQMWRLPITEPSLGGAELKYISDCVTSNWISSQGEYVRLFEQLFSEYVDVKYSLTTSNGTAALHLALVALGVGSGDEVIVPDLTFGASANTVIHTGAKPVFADVDKYTWTISPKSVESRLTDRTRAIMPVHLYGHPCDMDPILEIAKHNDLYVVEDCAEALGAKYKGQQVGGIGDVGCFSFFANKTITTGEGGMVVTNNPALQEKMKILRDHGMSKERRYWHLYAGFNYRMTNLQAAIGLAQMERIDSFLAHRQRVAQHYSQQLCGVNGIILPPKTDWAENIYWLYSVVIDEQRVGMGREDLVAKLTDCGIETRPFFYPLHVQPPYFSESNYDCPVSCWLAERGLSLPTSNSIDLNDIDRVCDSVKRIIHDNRLIRSHVNGSLVMEFVCDDRTMFQPIQERVGANSKERPSAFGG